MGDLSIESVFVTDAYPTHTYVSAEEGRIEKQLEEGLAIQNKIISIVGPSKCGKTVLCDRKFGTKRGEQKLMVTGDICDSADQFWMELFGQMTQSEYLADEYLPTRDRIIRAIASNGLPVIIDDFHYIEPEVQKKLCQQMKNAATLGIRFIVLNIPQRGDDPIRNNQDLSGRFFSIDINFWKEGVLREIGVKGFQALHVTIDGLILDTLATECLGSPQLMQALCLETGREYLSLDLPFEHQEIRADQFDWNKVRDRAVKSYDNSTLYSKLKNGPPRHGQARNTYPMQNGEEGDVYEVLVHTLATHPPFSSISLDDIRKRSQSILVEGEQPNFSAALNQLHGLFETGHMPLEYDEDKRTVHIIDPHFYFYLRTKAGF